jgi:hypothetical protein
VWPCTDSDRPHLWATLADLAIEAFRFLNAAVRSQTSLVAENLFLRKQLAFYQEHKVKPHRLTDAVRVALVFWSRWLDWQQALTIVQPEALIRWSGQLDSETAKKQANPYRAPDGNHSELPLGEAAFKLLSGHFRFRRGRNCFGHGWTRYQFPVIRERTSIKRPISSAVL